jgi:hypothetical protein
MAAIGKFPSSFQTACVLSMLVAKNHYDNPEQYMTWFAAQLDQMMPNGITCMSTSSASSCAQKRVALVIFGQISGCEWIGAGMACQELAENRGQIQIVDRLAFAHTSHWQAVLDDLDAHLAPPAPWQRAAPAEACSILTQKAPQWCASNVHVLALVVGPAAQLVATMPGAKLCGFHGPSSSDLWIYMQALKTIKSLCPHLMVSHFDQQVPPNPNDAEDLSAIFGSPFVMDSSQLRVPQPPYIVRSRPSANREAHGAPRPVARTPAVDRVNLELLQLFAPGAPFNVVLPSLQQIDAVLEKKADGLRLTPDESRALAMISETQVVAGDTTGHGEQRLLGRKAIAALFGIDQWSYLDHWQKKMPCSGLVNAVTGIPVAPGHPEAVECGCARWCPNCSEFYHCLLSCPNPHLVQHEVKHLLKSGLFTSDAELVKAPIATSELPSHVCSQPCSGMVA